MEKVSGWQLNRQVSLGVIVQIMLLASLIVGSWVNIQRQLDILGHDMNRLIQCQKEWQFKIDELNERSMGYEYRLRAMEKDGAAQYSN